MSKNSTTNHCETAANIVINILATTTEILDTVENINKEEISKEITAMITGNGPDKNIPIVFEKRYDNERYNTTTLYFVGTGNLFRSTTIEFDYATYFTIAVEYPSDHPEANYASISVLPTIEDAAGKLFDCDWVDIYLAPNIIEKLLDLEKKG